MISFPHTTVCYCRFTTNFMYNINLYNIDMFWNIYHQTLEVGMETIQMPNYWRTGTITHDICNMQPQTHIFCQLTLLAIARHPDSRSDSTLVYILCVLLSCFLVLIFWPKLRHSLQLIFVIWQHRYSKHCLIIDLKRFIMVFGDIIY